MNHLLFHCIQGLAGLPGLDGNVGRSGMKGEKGVPVRKRNSIIENDSFEIFYLFRVKMAQLDFRDYLNQKELKGTEEERYS